VTFASEESKSCWTRSQKNCTLGGGLVGFFSTIACVLLLREAGIYSVPNSIRPYNTGSYQDNKYVLVRYRFY
jgi:hypothetical protein